MRIAMGIIGLAVFTFPVLADEHDEVKQHLRELEHKYEALKKAEQHREANAVLERIVELRERVGRREAREHEEEEHGEGERHRHELREVLEQLEHGMAALRRLKRHELLREMERVAREVRHELEDRPRERRKREHPEHQAARRQIEVLRLAMAALMEKGKKDWAETLEHAIHATELRLEGRKDEEARRVFETAPNRENQVELLRYAARLYAEWGHEDRARACNELAARMIPKGKVEKAFAFVRDDEGRRKEREQAQRRIKRLEDRLARLERGMEEIQELLRDMRRDRSDR